MEAVATVGSMEVFKYDKSLQTRLQECSDVLQVSKNPVPAAQIRAEWSYFIEMRIEPAGWQTFWRIPRVICESLKVSYPTVVFGIVEQVHFAELRATFAVTGVLDDDVHLPERHEVALIDLLPTKLQENSAINVEATANCVDMLRYFYKHIWMPWDNENDDEQDWCEKHLKSRIHFNYDLQKKINRPLAAHIRALLAEVQDIQERRDYIEADLSDDDDEEETKSNAEITELMRLHLRVCSIKSKIEVLENPNMRDVYDKVRQTSNEHGDGKPSETGDSTFVVTRKVTIDEHQQQLDTVRSLLADVTQTVLMRPSLQQCLDACLPNSHIYLPAGNHEIKYVEPFVGSGTLSALPKSSEMAVDDEDVVAVKDDSEEVAKTIISSAEDDARLLTLGGNTVIEGITFDCQKVRTGIQIRSGSVLFIGCTFVGNEASSTKTGLIVCANARLWLTKCTVKNFAIGIECYADAQLSLQETTVTGCVTGIDCRSARFELSFRDSFINNCKRYGVAVVRETTPLANTTDDPAAKGDEGDGPIKYAAIDNVPTELAISGKCTFSENLLANIVTLNCGNKQLLLEDDVMHSDDQLFAMPSALRNGTRNVSQTSSISELDMQDDCQILDSDSDMSTSVIVLD